MSITALTSYATTLRQVTPASVATRDTQRAYSVVTNVLDRFASIKSEATEQGDTEVLKSRAMKLADTHGKRVENWLKHMSSDFQAAAASKQKVSITV